LNPFQSTAQSRWARTSILIC